MEELEFNRWSPAVQRSLALQAAWLSALVRQGRAPLAAEGTEERAERFRSLLEHYRPSNPWGHPAAEC
jgi:hypothetical protein